MRRRDFFLLLGGAGASWPFAALAQRGRARIGILSISSPEYEAAHVAAFREELERLGHIEGRTIDIDYRASSGDTARLTGLAQELIRMKPQAVLANAVTLTRLLNRLAPDLPIVCAALSDGFVPSLATSFARPGGRVTGVATDVEGLIGKLAELVFDIMPNASSIGFLSNPAGGSMGRFEQQVKTAAKARSVEVRVAQAEKVEEIASAATACGGQGAGRHRPDQRALQRITNADRGNGRGFVCRWCSARVRSCYRRPCKLRDQPDRKLAPRRHLRRQDPQRCYKPRPVICRSNFRPNLSW